MQICENARPLAVSVTAWCDLVQMAGDIGLALHMGCMTLDLDTLARYLERTAEITGASALRLVMEEERGEGSSVDQMARFLEKATVRARDTGLTLVIENHFHIPCRVLVEMARGYPENVVAFCLDSANSLRNRESPDQVFDLLEHRAAFYHLKDYQVRGSNVGFEVIGAPLGEGALDLRACLQWMCARYAAPLMVLENWVQPTGDWAADVAADAVWLARAATSNAR